MGHQHIKEATVDTDKNAAYRREWFTSIGGSTRGANGSLAHKGGHLVSYTHSYGDSMADKCPMDNWIACGSDKTSCGRVSMCSN